METKRSRLGRLDTTEIHLMESFYEPDNAMVHKLAATVRRYGQYKPIPVNKIDGTYKAMTETEYFLALQQAGMTQIDCIIYEMDEVDAILFALDCKFDFTVNNIKVSELLDKVKAKYTLAEISKFTHYSLAELKDIEQILHFDWSKYEEKTSMSLFAPEEEISNLPELKAMLEETSAIVDSEPALPFAEPKKEKEKKPAIVKQQAQDEGHSNIDVATLVLPSEQSGGALVQEKKKRKKKEEPTPVIEVDRKIRTATWKVRDSSGKMIDSFEITVLGKDTKAHLETYKDKIGAKMKPEVRILYEEGKTTIDIQYPDDNQNSLF